MSFHISQSNTVFARIVRQIKANKWELQPQIRKSWDSMENANKKRK